MSDYLKERVDVDFWGNKLENIYSWFWSYLIKL